MMLTFAKIGKETLMLLFSFCMIENICTCHLHTISASCSWICRALWKIQSIIYSTDCPICRWMYGLSLKAVFQRTVWYSSEGEMQAFRCYLQNLIYQSDRQLSYKICMHAYMTFGFRLEQMCPSLTEPGLHFIMLEGIENVDCNLLPF